MPDNNLLPARYRQKTFDQIKDTYAHRYDYLKDSRLPAPSPADIADLEAAYDYMNGNGPVTVNPGQAQPITPPVVDSNPLTAANNARLRQEAAAAPMTQDERRAAATRNYDIINGRRPLNDPHAPMAPPPPMAPMAPGPYPQQAAVETPMEVEPDQGEPLFAPEPPARQFTPDMPPRGEDPRVRIPGIRSQEVQPGRLQNDYIIGYDPYGQPVRRSIAPHADDYQVPATNKWTGAQRFDQQASKQQLIAMKIMIDGGIAPERAEQAALGMLSLDQREMDMLRANQKAQRQRQASQETARRQERMGDYYDGN